MKVNAYGIIPVLIAIGGFLLLYYLLLRSTLARKKSAVIEAEKKVAETQIELNTKIREFMGKLHEQPLEDGYIQKIKEELEGIANAGMPQESFQKFVTFLAAQHANDPNLSIAGKELAKTMEAHLKQSKRLQLAKEEYAMITSTGLSGRIAGWMGYKATV